jgi:hypothetical protein
MKMQVNWQTVINIILFAMLIVAFTFSIWSYLKTNSIKNSNSPSLPFPPPDVPDAPVINNNNTYVNNIASAPTLVSIGEYDEEDNMTYKVQSTDNGSNIAVIPSKDNYIINLDFTNVESIPGFYVKISNCMNTENRTPYTVVVKSKIDKLSPPDLPLNLPSGESVNIGFKITNITTNGGLVQQIYFFSESDIYGF